MRRSCFLVALMLGAALVLAGCDTNTEADRDDFETFEQGTWGVGSFRIDNTDLTDRLRDQYDSRVTFTFFAQDDEDDRRFEIFARRTGQQDRLIAGDIGIDGENDEMDFYPDSSGIGGFEVNYQILQDDRIVLTTEDNEGDGLVLRNILLPNSTVGDDYPEVRLVIAQQ
jgi:hypothetical protein